MAKLLFVALLFGGVMAACDSCGGDDVDGPDMLAAVNDAAVD